MLSKYNVDIPEESVRKVVSRLTNQLWKLIPMREHDEDWPKQLDTVIIEIAGFGEVFSNPHFLQLLIKLEGLKKVDMNFELYRKTVFESISLLQGLSYGRL